MPESDAVRAAAIETIAKAMNFSYSKGRNAERAVDALSAAGLLAQSVAPERYSNGALGRAEALAADDPDWMNAGGQLKPVTGDSTETGGTNNE